MQKTRRPIMDLLFSDFRWYRRMSGGRWVHVEARGIPGIPACWVREPFSHETVIDAEDWGARAIA